jgi:hypothetical protein
MDDSYGKQLVKPVVMARGPSKVGKMRRTSHWLVHIVHAARLVAWRGHAKHVVFERERSETMKVVVKVVEKWWKRTIEIQRYVRMRSFMSTVGLNLWVYKMRIQIIRKRLNVKRIIHFCEELKTTGGIMGRRILNAVHKLQIRIKRIQRCWRSWKLCTQGRLRVLRVMAEKVERANVEELQRHIVHKHHKNAAKTQLSLSERKQQKEMAEMEAKFAMLSGGVKGGGRRQSGEHKAHDVKAAYRRAKTKKLMALLTERREKYMVLAENGEDEEPESEFPFEVQQLLNHGKKQQARKKTKKKKKDAGQFDMESIKAIMHGQRRFSAVFFGRQDEGLKVEERPHFMFYTQIAREPKLMLKLVKKCMLESGYEGEHHQDHK